MPTKTSDFTNDGSDGTSTYVEADDLATVATTGDYGDLLNTPTIPTVNDATLTIQKNGTDVASFTANSATATTANIIVPTDTSDLTNGAGFITTSALSNYYTKSETYSQQEVNSLINTITIPTKTSDLTNDGSDGSSTYVEADDLATVATTGDYDDLLNKPTIPTIVDMTGATSSTAGAHGYVPAPAAGDEGKFLQGDGTWQTVAPGITYTAGNGIDIDANNEISVDTAVVATQTDLSSKQDTLAAGDAIDITNNVISVEADSALDVSSTNPVQNSVVTAALNGKQGTLTAGSNIQINNGVISATDTTYSDFVGTDGQTAGTHGLVPAPATTDAGEYLKADGTWDTPPGVTYTAGTGIDITGTTLSVDTSVIAELSDLPTKTSDLSNDGSDGTSTYVEADDLATVATSGLYSDLSGTPSLATVATSGDYDDLTNKPTIPAAQVNSDWNAASGVAQILNKPSLATVATTGDYDDLIDKPTIPTVNDATLTITQNGTSAGTFTANASSNATIALTDTTYSNFVGATSSVAGSAGLVPAPTTSDTDKVLLGDGTWGDPAAHLVEMSYGESNAWTKFINAYNDGAIVYCRASSNANPGTGSQTRKAFMAYVNNATSPTSVEFQYVRSVSSKSDSQQCDQVFVYTLTNSNGGTWSVASRDMATKINVDSTLNKTYSSGANASMTLSAKAMTGATSGAAGTAGIVPKPNSGDQNKYLKGDGTWGAITIPTVPTKTSDLTNDGSDGTSTYVEADDLATVATSGDYNDLSNLPGIPNYTAGDHIDITAGVISATDYVHSENPVSITTPGTTVSGSEITDGSITFDKTATGEFLKLQLTTTDPGEGAALAANTLLGVYQ